MTILHVGSRGSDLAVLQTRWVCSRLRSAHSSLQIEEVIIKTHGDQATDQPFDRDWPVGGFVGAIEQALTRGAIDFAVHSYKDLQTAITPGLTVAAVPGREVAYDVLVTRAPVSLEALPAGFRIGTSSPRRIAQFRRVADVEIVPIRGNVPTRVAKLERERLDGVVLAGAAVKRLNMRLPHVVNLPTDRFVPAPAQGALAIQVRERSEAEELVRVLDEPTARRAVEAERSFLRTISAGCHTPIGALASCEDSAITLHGQLFSDDMKHVAEGVETDRDPEEVGRRLAVRLLGELQEAP